MILWDYMNILFPNNLSLIGFSIHWWFLPESIITLLAVKWWFSNSIIPSICLNGHPFVKNFPSSHLYPLCTVLLWTHWFPFAIIHYYHYSLWSSSYPKFSQWESLPASPLSFGCVPIVWALPCFLHLRMLQAHFVPSPCLESAISPRKSAVHRVSKPRGSTNSVYVVPAPGCDLRHSPSCIASQALFSSPTEDFMSHPTPVNHSLSI